MPRWCWVRAGERLRPDAGRLDVAPEGLADRLSCAGEQPVGAIPKPDICASQVFNRPDHPLEVIKVELPARRQRDAAGFVLRAYPSGGLGAGRRTSSSSRPANGMRSAPAIALIWPAGGSEPCRTRPTRLVPCGSRRAFGRIQGDDQQDRTRGGEPDRRDPGAAGRRLRSDPCRPHLRAEGGGPRARRRPNSRSGATPRRAIGGSRCSAGPITLRDHPGRVSRPESGSSCRPRPTRISVRPFGSRQVSSSSSRAGSGAARSARLPGIRSAFRSDPRQRSDGLPLSRRPGRS